MPAPGPQRDRDVLGIHRRRAQQEHRRRRRLLDDLQQGVRRAFGQPVGVLDHHDLPAPGGRAARGDLHDGAHLVDADGQAFGNDSPHVGVGACHRRRAGPALPQPGSPSEVHCSAAAKHSAATERPEPGGPVISQACVIVPIARAAVSRITAGRLGGGRAARPPPPPGLPAA